MGFLGFGNVSLSFDHFFFIVYLLYATYNSELETWNSTGVIKKIRAMALRILVMNLKNMNGMGKKVGGISGW